MSTPNQIVSLWLEYIYLSDDAQPTLGASRKRKKKVCGR